MPSSHCCAQPCVRVWEPWGLERETATTVSSDTTPYTPAPAPTPAPALQSTRLARAAAMATASSRTVQLASERGKFSERTLSAQLLCIFDPCTTRYTFYPRAEVLPPIMYRVGLLAVLRSKFKAGG